MLEKENRRSFSSCAQDHFTLKKQISLLLSPRNNSVLGQHAIRRRGHHMREFMLFYWVGRKYAS
jgi:hypothetical protein